MHHSPVAQTLLADASEIWQAALQAVDPTRLVQRAVSVEPGWLRLGQHAYRRHQVRRLAVVGGGKAGRAMAEALENALGEEWLERKAVRGLINVLDEQAGQLSHIVLNGSRPAGAPWPTEAGQAGAETMLRMVASLGPSDLAVCLLSGGASAMMPAPVPGVSLQSKRLATQLLSQKGANIEDLNTVRKHLSQIKGGHLAQRCTAGSLVSLIISDVVGDRLEVVASGPTAPDPTTYSQALAVLVRHGILALAPPEVVNHLQRGARGELPETPKSLPPTVHNVVIGSNRNAVEAASARARQLGYRVLDLGSRLEGEAREAGVWLASLALSIRHEGRPLAPPACVVVGGETTVSAVAPGGKGGRNQELILSGLNHLSRYGMEGILLWSAGTDGEDGPTDAAGAWVDQTVLRAAQERSLELQTFLTHSRSYDFFAAAGGHVRSGPTGTNVMDLSMVLVR